VFSGNDLSKRERKLTAPRIKSISVKGFRAYGAAEQTLKLPSDLTVVWGPNSKGKTSLAEAFEFLLTGRITRREFMASTLDEFADALRNAYLMDGDDVYIAVQMIAVDGIEHEIKRFLTGDYTKRQDCTSRLEIDGKIAEEADLTKFGLIQSLPPFQAPILAQHTLSYIFSIRPQERASYFKTLLEVTDLEGLRNNISDVQEELKSPTDQFLVKFDNCLTISVFKQTFESFLHTIPDWPTFSTKIEDAACALIEIVGEKVPENLLERFALIERILNEYRNKVFPIREFEYKKFTGWTPPSSDIWTQLDCYLAILNKSDNDTRKLCSLFDEALKIPTISGITESISCPLCGTSSALKPERVQFIRQFVNDSKQFKTAETAAKSALLRLIASAETLADVTESALPHFFKISTIKRREMGFTIARIRELLGDHKTECVKPWLSQIRPFSHSEIALHRKAKAVIKLVNEQIDGLTSILDISKLQAAFSTLEALCDTYSSEIDAYEIKAETLIKAINEALDAKSDIAGWQDFLTIAQQPQKLRTLLIERVACANVGKELDMAIRQIDHAKEQVLDDKFSDYSTLIQTWWERLRPDEPTFFSALKLRKGAKRTIDFKAGLSDKPDRSTPKLRDVIAVFSHSQLHCLGLAIFLARAQHERLGFIILDDPVLSSDADYRIHFNSTVLTELLKLSIQVIILTQDHDTWEELEIRYRHCGISNAQIYIENPAKGSIIENTSDNLLAKINRAKCLAHGGHPDSRKQCGILLRDAGERFCKEMLVNDQIKNCFNSASLTDYDHKTLEWLCPHVEQLLNHDASHPGKIEAFKKIVNNACHDNVPPNNSEMIYACGEIRFFLKEYLIR